MTTEEALIKGNEILGIGLSPNVLSLCALLIDHNTVSCDGLVLTIKEIIKEIE